MAEELGHETIQRNKEDIQELFKMINSIKNRPPLWASLLITVMGCVITWMAKGN